MSGPTVFLHSAAPFRRQQQPQRSDHGQAQTLCQPARSAVIEDDPPSFLFHGQADGFAFAVSQGGTQHLRPDRLRQRLLHNPIRELNRGHLPDHGRRDDQLGKQSGQQVELADSVQGNDRAGVGNDWRQGHIS